MPAALIAAGGPQGVPPAVHRMNRVLSLLLRSLVISALLAAEGRGQVAPAPAPGGSIQSASAAARSDSTWVVPARKSPVGAAVLGLVFPGSAHWYAGERGRGTLVAAVYFAGFLMVKDGRTDRVGQAAGVATIGALGFSIIDGVRAVRRFNRRQAAAAAPPPRRELPP